MTIFNVLDYGAVGGGVVDDGPAIRAAAQAAAGNALLFPAGKIFRCVNGFQINGNGSQVMGYGATVIYPQTSSPWLHCVRIAGNGIGVHGLTIESQGVTARDQTGFAISAGWDNGSYCSRVTIKDVSCLGIGSAGIWLTRCLGAKVTGSTVGNCFADGIHLSDGCYDAIVKGNHLFNNADDNIAVVNDIAGAPYSGRVIVSGNVIQGGMIVGGHSGHGLAVIGSSIVSATGNIIANTVGPGIGTYFWNDQEETDHLLIQGNSISNCGYGGNEFGGLAINLQQTKKCKIIGNDITNIQYAPSKVCAALRATDCIELYVKSNIFTDLACDGFVIPQSSNTSTIVFSGNDFGYVARTPVNVNAPSASVVRINNNNFCGTAGATDIFARAPVGALRVRNNDTMRAVDVA